MYPFVDIIIQALVSQSTPTVVINPNGIAKFNPTPDLSAPDIVGPIKRLNKVEKIGSSIYGETWSDLLFRALGENELLYNAFEQTDLTASFEGLPMSLNLQLKAVAKLIKNKSVRGVDRDVFYVENAHFDTHSDGFTELNQLFTEVNTSLGSFVREMKAQGRWDDVVVVYVSEFGRTLSPNTSGGSDHAWGGNYFVAGGNLTGGKVLGQYLTDFNESSNPNMFNPGIVIPTTSWDQVWEPIAKWYGITGDSDLNYILPSRKNFAGPLNGMFA